MGYYLYPTTREIEAVEKFEAALCPAEKSVTKFLTESSKSQPTASIAQSNKQRIGTCLYQEWCKPLLISCEAAFGYEQVAKRIANIRLTQLWSGASFLPRMSKRQQFHEISLTESLSAV